jgi:small Trp-rich protein
MWFLGLGLVLLLLKVQEIGPVAGWDWMWVLSPLAMAVVWWAWADSSGYTKRKAVERENKRKDARIERQREQLGMLPRRKK